MFDSSSRKADRLPFPHEGPESGDRAATEAAWLLQFEYVGWRREAGLEPTRDALNLWELAMERIGEELEAEAGRLHP